MKLRLDSSSSLVGSERFAERSERGSRGANARFGPSHVRLREALADDAVVARHGEGGLDRRGGRDGGVDEVRVLESQPRREHARVGSSERDPSRAVGDAEFALGVRDESRGVGERLGGGEVAEGRDGEVARGLGGAVESVFEGEDERAAARRHLDGKRAVGTARGHHRGVERGTLAAHAQKHQRRGGSGGGGGGRSVGRGLVLVVRMRLVLVARTLLSLRPVRVVREVSLLPRSRLEAVEMVEGLGDPSLRGEGRGRRGGGRRVEIGRRARRVDEPPRAEVRPQRRGTTREAPVRMGRDRRDARGERGGDERRHARQRRRATRRPATPRRHPNPEPDIHEASARARVVVLPSPLRYYYTYYSRRPEGARDTTSRELLARLSRAQKFPTRNTVCRLVGRCCTSNRERRCKSQPNSRGARKNG